jgi:hypothetical protein
MTRAKPHSGPSLGFPGRPFPPADLVQAQECRQEPGVSRRKKQGRHLITDASPVCRVLTVASAKYITRFGALRPSAFIPRDVPGSTVEIRQGDNRGKTAIPFAVVSALSAEYGCWASLGLSVEVTAANEPGPCQAPAPKSEMAMVSRYPSVHGAISWQNRSGVSVYITRASLRHGLQRRNSVRQIASGNRVIRIEIRARWQM